MLQVIADSTSDMGPSKRGGLKVFSYNHHGIDVKHLHEVVQFFDLLRDTPAEEMKENERSPAESHIETELTMGMQDITCE
jgi:hypothetical protein